jgi:hypothetical protein
VNVDDQEQPFAADWTAKEHIAEALRLLDGPTPGIEDYDLLRADNLAAAQVHATLAVALRRS